MVSQCQVRMLRIELSTGFVVLIKEVNLSVHFNFLLMLLKKRNNTFGSCKINCDGRGSLLAIRPAPFLHQSPGLHVTFKSYENISKWWYDQYHCETFKLLECVHNILFTSYNWYYDILIRHKITSHPIVFTWFFLLKFRVSSSSMVPCGQLGPVKRGIETVEFECGMLSFRMIGWYDSMDSFLHYFWKK